MTAKYPFYFKLACILVAILIIGHLVSLGELILVPLCLGALFATLLLPVARFFEHKLRFSRSLAAIVSTVLMTALIAGILFVIGHQLARLSNDWPEFQQHFEESFTSIKQWIDQTFGVSVKEQNNYLSKTKGTAFDKGSVLLGVTLLSLSSIVLLVIFTFLFTFFMLIYRKHIVKFLVINFQESHHPTVMEVVTEIQYVVKKYLVGLIIQMVIVGTLVFIALTIIGVKYAWLIGLISGIFNVLPYIGILISLVIACFIAFGTTSITSVIFVIISYLIIHSIDGNYIMPKIVGSKVKINSMIAMIGIVIGEMLWGIAGMFLAIPMIAVFKIVMDRIHETKAWGYLLGEDDEEPPMFSSAIKRMFKGKEKKTEIKLDELKD